MGRMLEHTLAHGLVWNGVTCLHGVTLGLRAAVISTLCCLAAFALPASAQDQGLDGGSYITPFPEGDVYNMRVVGDSLASGLHGVLMTTIGRDGRVKLNRSRWTLNGLTRAGWRQEIRDLKRDLLGENAHVAVIMVGAWDTRSMRDSSGRRIATGTDEWRQEYTRRIDRMMKALKDTKVAVYWVGLPSMRRWKNNAAVQVMNDAVRERAYLNGLRFIDAFPSFASPEGGYTAYGPDLSGKVRLLRERDGIHLTFAGNQKLAHFVEREIKRDLTQAKAERAIPLAGSEAEQARIAARTAAGETGDAITGWQNSVDKAKPDGEGSQQPRTIVPGGLFMNATGQEQKADNGRVNLKTIDPAGREQIIALDIVRPAIPASVVSLVTRKQSPDRLNTMGDTLVDQIAGGLNIMSSVTPPNDALGGSRRKLSPAQTPFFRVLVKGERLAPRVGRADDFSWPRPEPPPMPRVRKRDETGGEGEGGIPLPGISPFRPRA